MSKFRLLNLKLGKRFAAFPIAFILLTGCNAEDLVCGGPPPNNKPIVPQLLYPVPGIKGVPDNAPTMVVAYGQSPTSAFPIILTPGGGSGIQLGGMHSPPNPLPTPIAKELVPGMPTYGVSLPALSPATTYSTSYKDTTSYCGQSSVNYYRMGSFTTK
ncbi:MAG TPA: hypothetical protein VJP76_05195 [Candidatus Tumulicola sp.]|nr:hypothetical protein [Candidatus Tumulicola sp.]